MDNELIGSKVQTVPNIWLSDKYFGLKGTIIQYKEEPVIRRDPKHGNNQMPTGKVDKVYQVEFDCLPEGEMSRKLGLFRAMFKIIGAGSS